MSIRTGHTTIHSNDQATKLILNRDAARILLEIGFHVGDFGLELISSALRPLKSIQFLSLLFMECNDITDEGLTTLGMSLGSLLTLN